MALTHRKIFNERSTFPVAAGRQRDDLITSDVWTRPEVTGNRPTVANDPTPTFQRFA